MRTLIVDDESAARSRLTRLLRDFPEVNIVGEASNGLEAVELLESLQPDLLFLDIQMGGMDGFSVLRSLPHNARIPLVIFATGFDQYALDAFEANALAYLLKPIEKDKLASAVQRAQLLLQSEDARRREDQNIRVALEEKAPLRKIVGRKHNRYVLLDPEEILWFYSDDRIVRARTDSDSYWVNYQLNQLEESLKTPLFFRARREILVNVEKISSVKPYDRSTFVLTMANAQQTEFVVSERQSKMLRRLFPGL